uniref:Uncharacterized protein n=1 Tax=Fagus sylvatica TaxID=28930 RepID=A0A2N9F8E3_FAGSY
MRSHRRGGRANNGSTVQIWRLRHCVRCWSGPSSLCRSTVVTGMRNLSPGACWAYPRAGPARDSGGVPIFLRQDWVFLFVKAPPFGEPQNPNHMASDAMDNPI